LNKYLHNDTSETEVSINANLNNGSENLSKKRHCDFRKTILIYIQQDAMFSLFENCSKCFAWYHRPSSGAQTTVPTASGICHTGIAICRYRGRVGTVLCVLWVAHINYIMLQLVGYINKYIYILMMHGPMNVEFQKN
jgi:hypothetical protein